MRGLPRRALQPRDARGALQGQDHLRGPRHADRGGGGVLRGGPGDPPPPADAGRRRPRLRPARPAGADAVRRRGAARQAGVRAAEAADRPDDLRARRADHRPALRGHPQAARRPQPPRRRRATRSSSSSTTSTSSRRPTGSSTWGPRAAPAAAPSSPQGTPEQVATVEASHTGRFLAEILGGRGPAGHRSPAGEPPAPADVKGRPAVHTVHAGARCASQGAASEDRRQGAVRQGRCSEGHGVEPGSAPLAARA